MRANTLLATALGLLAATSPAAAQAGSNVLPPPRPDTTYDPVRIISQRLDLDKYKATIKGLTQFGDRRQGTDRNANAVTWIETQLRSYGCADVERIRYEYNPPAPVQRDSATRAAAAARARAGGTGQSQGGGKLRGVVTRTGVNTDSLAQTDLRVRALNSQPTKPGIREEVYCTKVGSTHPEEMYIVGGHMDGHGWGEAANDDGSGTALVMELARVFSMPDVKTDRSIRFALWNNEETGLNGAKAYVDQRQALQGKEMPAGSGKYPEPRWLGMIQHDMMMFDHGMPNPDGTMRKEQRPEADVNIEFQSSAKMADGAQKLAWFFQSANEKYATDYPAAVGQHMTNTDSGPFMDIIPAISLRENERGPQVGAGWDPQWHQVTDMYSTYSDKDFRLGLNAAQTTLGAIGLLVGTSVIR
ncbi:MAG: peptidase [Gemmatimonadetes bacterium]|nr:peptidase [Gemmatimonadota bacterium]